MNEKAGAPDVKVTWCVGKRHISHQIAVWRALRRCVSDARASGAARAVVDSGADVFAVVEAAACVSLAVIGEAGALGGVGAAVSPLEENAWEVGIVVFVELGVVV